MNKPKAIGTAAESAVVKFLHSIGYNAETAMRKTLSGASDVGDVWCHHESGTLVIEVKGGEAARSASHAQITAWLAEAEREAAVARNQLDRYVTAVLVVQTRGIGTARAGEWRCYVSSEPSELHPGFTYPVSMRFCDFMLEHEPHAA